MRKFFLAVGSLLLLCGITWQLTAQQKRVSPHEQASISIGGKKITIDYGRPYMRGRKIMGGLVPYGEVWRTGADEATKLTTEADLEIAGLKVPKGSYGLFTLPSEKGWKLVVNKVADQWGAFKYDQGQDFGRVDTTMKMAGAPLEQLTISFSQAGQNQGTLTMAWETTVVSVPFTVR